MKSATVASTKPAPRETLNIRIPTAERNLIDRALVLVGPAKFEKFLALLEAPAKPNARLRRTMKTAPPWREG